MVSLHFSCASCASIIAPESPRVRCLICTDACDLCANCVLGEKFREPHLATHAVQVLKQSGGGDTGLPTLPGTTAICYYAPPPVPTLPVMPEAGADDSVADSIARLSINPRATSTLTEHAGESTQGPSGADQHPVQFPAQEHPPPSLHPSSVQDVPAPDLSQTMSPMQHPVPHHEAPVPAPTTVPATYQQAPPLGAPPAQPLPPQYTGPQQGSSSNSVPPGYANASPLASPPAGSPASVHSRMSNPPPVPPRRPNTTRYSTQPTGATPPSQYASMEPAGWQSFFLADMSPSPTFITLMNDVFSYLDPRNLGNLEPEVFSRFLDDLGYMPHENAWKMGLQATYGLSAESMADKSLKNAFDLFSIDHVLLKRIQAPHEDPTGITAQYKRILGAAFKPSMLQNAGSAHSTMEGPMPAITRKGFIDIMALEAKAEPSREWGNWCRLLRMYNLPRYAGWGDLPRECFPEYPDPVTLKRVDDIRKISERQGREKLEAARVYSQLSQQGQQNALDLIGNVRYEYVYR